MRDDRGAVVGASTIDRDITEQRWLATTLDSTLSALEAAVDEARALETRSRRFLADAAHQLRTPIAGIRACAETLLRGASRADRDRLLTEMVRETSRASRLMVALLQIARLDQGESLAPVASDMVELCRSEAERAQLLAPDLDIALHADGSVLLQSIPTRSGKSSPTFSTTPRGSVSGWPSPGALHGRAAGT